MFEGVFITNITEEHVKAWKGENGSEKIAGYLISERTGKEYLITKSQSIVGRDFDVDFHIQDNSYVCKKQAIIHKENNQFFIEDIGSVNLTKVNGVLLEYGKKILLDSSVEIEFANERYSFVLR